MSLLNSVKAEGTETVKAEAKAPVVETKKKSNYEYQKKAKAAKLAAANLLKDELTSKKVALSDEAKKALDLLCAVRHPSANAGNFGKPSIYKIFGDKPVKGAAVTAIKIFEDTGKGFGDMRSLIKKWDKNGIKVSYDETKKSYVLNSDVEPFVEG